jgi:hypothetical protein
MSEPIKTLIARLEWNPIGNIPAQLTLYRNEKDLEEGCDCAILELNADQLTKLAFGVGMNAFNLDLQEYDRE